MLEVTEVYGRRKLEEERKRGGERVRETKCDHGGKIKEKGGEKRIRGAKRWREK